MNLKDARRKINKIDDKLIALIAERQSYMPFIGKYKKDHKLPFHQAQRENEIIESRRELATKLGVDSDLIKKIFALIFANSKKIQRKQ